MRFSWFEQEKDVASRRCGTVVALHIHSEKARSIKLFSFRQNSFDPGTFRECFTSHNLERSMPNVLGPPSVPASNVTRMLYSCGMSYSSNCWKETLLDVMEKSNELSLSALSTLFVIFNQRKLLLSSRKFACRDNTILA